MIKFILLIALLLPAGASIAQDDDKVCTFKNRGACSFDTIKQKFYRPGYQAQCIDYPGIAITGLKESRNRIFIEGVTLYSGFKMRLVKQGGYETDMPYGTGIEILYCESKDQKYLKVKSSLGVSDQNGDFKISLRKNDNGYIVLRKKGIPSYCFKINSLTCH